MEEIEHFTYLVSIVDMEGVTDADVKARIGTAMLAFLQRKNVCKCSFLSLKNKMAIFNTN